MIYVEGTTGPNKLYTSKNIARIECRRLTQQPNNRGKVVSVLKVVESYKANIVVNKLEEE